MESHCNPLFKNYRQRWHKLAVASHHIETRAQVLGASLPPLLVAASRISATVMMGVHGLRRAGAGDNFWAYRPYSFGDSTQRIDWQKSAKSDQAFIREKEWEAANTLWLWVNRGPRMAFQSHLAEATKLYHAQVLSLAIAQLALRAHERVGYLDGVTRASHGRHMFEKLAISFASPNDGALPSTQGNHRYSTGLFVSDFLEEPQTLQRTFAPMAESGMRGHLVQVIDPAEEALPYDGRVEFLSLDTPQKFHSPKTQNLREDYATAFLAQREAVQALAKKLGWSFSTHRTDQTLASAVLALYEKMKLR
jgi:uncharacterized protein (DUF58 family)